MLLTFSNSAAVTGVPLGRVKALVTPFIEKVTGRTDFLLDGIPEIEVDSAVLSLYLNRLYDEKTDDNINKWRAENQEASLDVESAKTAQEKLGNFFNVAESYKKGEQAY